MKRIDPADGSQAVAAPAKTAKVAPGHFTEGSPTVAATQVTAEWADAIQEEILGIIEVTGGLTSDHADNNQAAAVVYGVRAIIAGGGSDLTAETTTDTRAVIAAKNCDTGGDSGGADACSVVMASEDSKCITGGAGTQRLVAASFDCDVAAATNRGAIVGSYEAAITGTGNCFLAASTTGTVVSGARAAAVGTTAVDAAGTKCAVIASAGQAATGADCLADGTHTAIIASRGITGGATTIGGSATEALIAASYDATISSNPTRAAVIGSAASDLSDGDRAAILASYQVLLNSTGSEHAIVASSGGSSISGAGAAEAIVACDDVDITSNSGSNAIIASAGFGGASPTISGAAGAAAIVASSGDVAITGTEAFIAACSTGAGGAVTISGGRSAAIGCEGNVTIAALNTVVLASQWGAAGIAIPTPGDDNKVILGDVAAGLGATRKTVELDAVAGTVACDAAVMGGPIDLAEMFENEADGELAVGSIVSHAGGKAKLAEVGDRVLGVVSANPAFVGGGASLHWDGLVARDEFGAELWEDVPCVRWPERQSKKGKVTRKAFDGFAADAPGKVPKDAEHYTRRKRVGSESYDPSREYVPRADRPNEWTVVGLLGQIRVRVDDTVEAGSYVVPSEVPGVGTHADEPPRTGRPIECFEVVAEATEERGCAIALCLVG